MNPLEALRLAFGVVAAAPDAEGAEVGGGGRPGKRHGGPVGKPARAPVVGPQGCRSTGASPNSAYFVVQNLMPGQQAVHEVCVGDEVPGLGKVQRIGQRGTVWEAQTAGGTIEH